MVKLHVAVVKSCLAVIMAQTLRPYARLKEIT